MLLASSGLKTSLRDIADACGILPGSLYHHFESKDAIIVELVARYRADLDGIAEDARDALNEPDPDPVPQQIENFGKAIAACAVRHRAALLLTLYEPPAGASDQLVQVAMRSPLGIDTAMLEVLRAGRKSGYIRPGVDLATLADRLCACLLHISLGVFPDVRGSDEVPLIRCRIVLDGIAVNAPDDVELDRSKPFEAAAQTIDEWDKVDAEEDDRLPMLRAVARTEFGRRGYEATTVRHIAAAAGLSTGSVYRLVGSKDDLLMSIMRSFTTKARSAWTSVLKAEGTTVEKLDALMWINLNVVDRFSDEFNIQLAWLRESPPNTTNLGASFSARLRDLKSLLAQGLQSGELHLYGSSADIRAWSLFELLWMPENIVRKLGCRDAHTMARETVLRGAAAHR